MKAMDHHNGMTVTVALEVILHIASQYKKIIFEDTFFFPTSFTIFGVLLQKLCQVDKKFPCTTK